MTLSAKKLESKLLDFFKKPNFDTPFQAAMAWTDAYDAYARDAADASGDPVVMANRAVFQAALQFDAKTGAAPKFAQMLDTAFVGYWTGAIFAVGKPPTPAAPCPSIGGNTIFGAEVTSIVVAAVPGILMNLLLPIFSGVTKATTAEQQAAQIAAAFHAATTSAVTVLIAGLDTTPPPGGPQPITNTCTVF